MIKINSLCGFVLVAETQEGLQNFTVTFDWVWDGLDVSVRNAIRSRLKQVVWTDTAGRVPTDDELIFVNWQMVGDLGCMAQIAHELRGVWQAATNFYASERAGELGARVDRILFAESVTGVDVRSAADLYSAGLTNDDEFLAIAMAWPGLNLFKKELIQRIVEKHFVFDQRTVDNFIEENEK